MAPKVQIVEIGPRDGFQNVKEYIPLEVKLRILDGLVGAGFRKIQLTSFVSPKAIPQLRDAAQIAAVALAKYPEIAFFALVPNLMGAQNAAAAGLKEVSPVMSLSLSHNLANVKRTHERSIDEIRRIREELPDLRLTQDIATAFACPFEGEMPVEALLRLLEKLKKLDIKAFTLCDTVGMAYPAQVEHVLETVKREFPDTAFHIHIHDTRNMGVLNSYVALQCGADSVQTAIGGLGGCPFAPGASGNTSSEDLVYMLNQCGYETGIDFDKLLETAKYTQSVIDGNFSGHHIHIPEHPCVLTQE